MGEFQGSRFTLRLPDGAVDLSTYAFALPGDQEFRPSIVVKFQPHDASIDLAQHMIEQRGALRERVGEFEVISEWSDVKGSLPRVSTLFEWTAAGSPRLRQRQVFIHVARHSLVYSLTATDTAHNFNRSEPLLESIIESFTVIDA